MVVWPRVAYRLSTQPPFFFLGIGRHVINLYIDQAAVNDVEAIGNQGPAVDETVVNQSEGIFDSTFKTLTCQTAHNFIDQAGDIKATIVDSPNFFNTSGCPQCAVDEHFEKGTHGGYVSCKCVRRANGRVQSDMLVDGNTDFLT